MKIKMRKEKLIAKSLSILMLFDDSDIEAILKAILIALIALWKSRRDNR